MTNLFSQFDFLFSFFYNWIYHFGTGNLVAIHSIYINRFKLAKILDQFLILFFISKLLMNSFLYVLKLILFYSFDLLFCFSCQRFGINIFILNIFQRKNSIVHLNKQCKGLMYIYFSFLYEGPTKLFSNFNKSSSDISFIYKESLYRFLSNIHIEYIHEISFF